MLKKGADSESVKDIPALEKLLREIQLFSTESVDKETAREIKEMCRSILNGKEESKKIDTSSKADGGAPPKIFSGPGKIVDDGGKLTDLKMTVGNAARDGIRKKIVEIMQKPPAGHPGDKFNERELYVATKIAL